MFSPDLFVREGDSQLDIDCWMIPWKEIVYIRVTSLSTVCVCVCVWVYVCVCVEEEEVVVVVARVPGIVVVDEKDDVFSSVTWHKRNIFIDMIT